MTMTRILHQEMAAGKWFKLSLVEQLANIGSEVSRAQKWQMKDENIFWGAVERALELFDLTLTDSRWKGRLREIGRVKEVFCDAVTGGEEYNSSLNDIEKYFFHYGFATRNYMGA